MFIEMYVNISLFFMKFCSKSSLKKAAQNDEENFFCTNLNHVIA